MKKIFTKIIGSIVILTFLLSSCQIEKRHYTSGYNVKWFGSGSHSVAKNSVNKPSPVAQITPAKALESPKISSSDMNENENSTFKTRELNSSTASVQSNAPFVYSAIENIKATQGESTDINNESQIGKSYSSVLDQNNNSAKKRMPIQSSGNGKSWIVCVLLCFFLGIIGIHRFYMGYTWQGIVQILTLGGFGLWTFIDFIRILMKDLKPKDGDYTD